MMSSAQMSMAQAYGSRLLILSKGMLHDIYKNPNLADNLGMPTVLLFFVIYYPNACGAEYFNFHIKPAHAIIADLKMRMALEFVLKHCKCATH
jgi:hypothetical protein